MGRKAVSYLLYNLLICFTAFALLLALCCWRASFISPQQGGIWVLLGFVMPAVLLLNGLLLGLWLIRRKWLVAVLPLAALLVNMDYISAMMQLPEFGARTQGQGDLRVATFNVHGFSVYDSKRASARAVAALMRRERVDIICFQELLDSRDVPVDSIAAEFSGFTPYYARELSMAVFSRYPILDHEYVRFPDSDNSYFRADIAVDGVTIRVISAHLQTSGIAAMRRRFRKDYGCEAPVEVVLGLLEENARIRAEQVRVIREVIDRSKMPVILAGDFNDTPSSYTYRSIKGNMTDGFQSNGSGYGGSYRYFLGLLRIDFIFYNDYFAGVDYYMPDDELSDHKAVIAELRLRR